LIVQSLTGLQQKLFFEFLCYNVTLLDFGGKMLSFKRVMLVFVLMFSLAEAAVLNGISIIVENEPITTAEIKALQHSMRISKSKATDLLIQNALQKSVSKDIHVSDDEIDAKIQQISAINKISIKKMQQILKKQGMKWYDYRQRVQTEIKKQKFYQSNIAPLIPIPGEDQLKLFYKKNRKIFKVPTKITMVEYSAGSIEELKAFASSKKLTKGIKSKTVTKNESQLTPQLFSMAISSPVGSYMQPMNAGDKFVMYKIKGKSGSKILPFDKARNGVIQAWKHKQRKQATEDYFKKLKTSANIVYVRK
jgi:parvulin-like peptidyl-prolyl isomerase